MSAPLVEYTPRCDIHALVRAWRGRRGTNGRPPSSGPARVLVDVAGPWFDYTAGLLISSPRRGKVVLVGCSAGGVRWLTVVRLVGVPQLGGVRWWARCPGCGGQTSVVYANGPMSAPWVCQDCAGLAHAVEREDELASAARASARIRARLRADGPFARPGGPVPPRPPRMWRRTYGRLCAELRKAEARADRALAARVQRIAERAS